MVIILDILNEACKQVYTEIHGLIGTPDAAIRYGRGAGGDISRKIDLVAEDIVKKTFDKYDFYPTIVGEECGIIEGRDKGYVIMDAIDGTLNAIRGIPFSCCSIAYASDFNLSNVTDSSIIDFSNGDIYYATKGKGAFLNDDIFKIRTRNINLTSLDDWKTSDIILGANISGISIDDLNKLSSLFSLSSHVRHLGANALELCYFARGYMDIYIDFRSKIRPTDMAAGYLIAKEAGGLLFSDTGSELDSDLGMKTTMSFIAVSGKSLHQIISNLLTITNKS